MIFFFDNTFVRFFLIPECFMSTNLTLIGINDTISQLILYLKPTIWLCDRVKHPRQVSGLTNKQTNVLNTYLNQIKNQIKSSCPSEFNVTKNSKRYIKKLFLNLALFITNRLGKPCVKSQYVCLCLWIHIYQREVQYLFLPETPWPSCTNNWRKLFHASLATTTVNQSRSALSQ